MRTRPVAVSDNSRATDVDPHSWIECLLPDVLLHLYSITLGNREKCSPLAQLVRALH